MHVDKDNADDQVQNNNTNTKEILKQNYRYDVKDTGPFQVFLESKQDNAALGRLHPMSIGKLILLNHKEIDAQIIEITSLGKNRVKVVLRTFSSANKLLNSVFLKTKIYRHISLNTWYADWG